MSITVIERNVRMVYRHFYSAHASRHHYQALRTACWINIEVDIMGKYIEKLLGAHTHANPFERVEAAISDLKKEK